MKKKNFTFAFLLLFILPQLITAQVNIEVINEKATLSVGNQNVYKVIIPEANLETVKKEWTKIIRQNTKSKVVLAGTEINIGGTIIKEIYDKPFNIYSALISDNSYVTVFAAYEIDSVFFEYTIGNKTIQTDKINSSINELMRNFAVTQYKNAVSEKLDLEEKNLEKLNKEYENLNNQVESDRKEIKENEQNIKNAEDAIAGNEKENERKVTQINSKKEALAAVKDDPELNKITKDQLKELEKEKRSIENELEKSHKEIITYQANIEDLNRQIEDNLKIIEEKNSEIVTQQQVVKDITKVLQGIK
jgi:predicted  nucleic acid-binding Zn-ribbon protein